MSSLPPRPSLPGPREPRLAVAWQTRGHSALSSLRALLGGPKAPRTFRGEPYFRDSWVRTGFPGRGFSTAILWHATLILLIIRLAPLIPQAAPPVLPDVQITWSGPLLDLPTLKPPGPASKLRPRPEPAKPLPPRGADAFHPRQTIISSPMRPTHPRQTLIRPDAPPEPPKILPALPNIVQLGKLVQPNVPQIQIPRAVLAKLRPKAAPLKPLPEPAVPDLPNQENRVGELNIASSALASAKPQMPVAPMSTPRPNVPQAAADSAPAPDLQPRIPANGSGLHTIIALSALPAPPAPSLPLPNGNLAAKISISPEGRRRGVPGGSPNGFPGNSGGGPANSGGDGLNPTGISITGGDPRATSSISGLGSRGRPLASLPPKPEPAIPASPLVSRSSTSEITALAPGARPESVFGQRRIYTLHVNMPNLTSATGSWVLHFVELFHATKPGGPTSSDITGPVPLRTVDPKYPPVLAGAGVEGEVVLYAVIRADGSVDSIQLVKGIDPVLDENAMVAFSKWKFRPAERDGAPIELETVVHIPFRARAPGD